MRRAAPIIALGESAAMMDASFRPLRERAHANIRAMLRAIATASTTPAAGPGLTAPQPPTRCTRRHRDHVPALHRRWRPPHADEYAAWLTATLEAALLR